ncbi:TonB family protein [Cupriavidus sp. AU9028]|nr:TonB family protein [Cupriavidus sp. AU9028]MBY4897392.1 TonB family protein [Cupriavidus sp. AU9028]
MARALAISLAVHALLLAVRFGAPQTFGIRQPESPLDVVLVNARSSSAPRNAAALAQANLDGGGEHERQQAQTPLPAQPVPRDGEPIRALQRQVELLEQEQQQLLSQIRQAAPPVPRQAERPQQARQDHPGQDERTALDEMARLEAEIGRNLEHYGRRPKRHQLTATSAKAVAYAEYYDRLRRRIEQRGTADFPQRGGKPLYGELILVINVNGDGHLGYRRGGQLVDGIELVKSSGDPALDRQAIAIVRAAAPFGPFTPEMRARYDILEVISTFKFSRSGLDTRLQSR